MCTYPYIKYTQSKHQTPFLNCTEFVTQTQTQRRYKTKIQTTFAIYTPNTQNIDNSNYCRVLYMQQFISFYKGCNVPNTNNSHEYNNI